MALPANPIDFILHIDSYMQIIIENYGFATYFILFAIIFCETGLVFMPLLPGDSLLFVAGALAARGSMNILFLFLLISIAAILGDAVNYWIGSHFGEKILKGNRFIKPEYLQRTKDFYKKHGAKTIIYARFVPIIRTFAPFVAGIGEMPYTRFFSFNIIGALAWVFIFLLGGFYFGGIPIIEENLTLVIFAIIFISLIPPILEYIRHRKSNS